ncbi:MAG: rRNA maturation RNase YbeY [Candidatus Gracilibacteria bacterium]|nr:rRNA maturation RNase YbeY [Candidatus Gracilibacteria bacterium]
MFKYNLIVMPIFSVNTYTIDCIFEVISNKINIIQNGTINIVFLDDDSIKNLNNNYRKIDKSTDVLSFHYYDDFTDLNDEDIAGEIIMSETKIKTQAIEYGLGEEKEFYKLLIHSILHILGFDHEIDEEYKIMQNLEENIYKEVFEK